MKKVKVPEELIEAVNLLLDKINSLPMKMGACPEILVAQVFINKYNNNPTATDKAVIVYETKRARKKFTFK